MSEERPHAAETPAAFAARYFDAVSPFYDGVTTGSDSDWTPNGVLAEVLTGRLSRGMRALDVGAGTGQTVDVLLRWLTPGDVTAIDVSEGMLDVLRERFPAVATQCLAIDELDEDSVSERFDLITSIGTLEFVPDLETFLAACGGLLRAGGLLAITYLPAIFFHERQSPGDARDRTAADGVRREPGRVLALLVEHGFTIERDVELVAYCEAGEPIIYHLVVARRGSATHG